MRPYRKTCAALLSVFFFGAVGTATAVAAYPDKPITIIVPYSPGAAGDVIFRMLQPQLAQELGESLIVDYKTGAGGNIGSQYVANSKPDGYTLLFSATNNFVINQFVYKNIGYEPFDDLYVINKVADAPAIVYISSSTGAKNIDEFRDYVQKNKGQTNYGTPGAGTTPALSAWKLSKELGGDMLDIHYRGSAPGVQALLSGEVQMYIGGYGLASAFLQYDKVRAIGIALDERFPALPDVPTFKELGYEDTVVSNWWALAAPAKTPVEITNKIEAALAKVTSNPELREKLLAQGYVLATATGTDFRTSLPKQADYWKSIVKEADLKIQ